MKTTVKSEITEVGILFSPGEARALLNYLGNSDYFPYYEPPPKEDELINELQISLSDLMRDM